MRYHPNYGLVRDPIDHAQARPRGAGDGRRRRWQVALGAVGALAIAAGLSPIGGSTAEERVVIPLELPGPAGDAGGEPRRVPGPPWAHAGVPARVPIARTHAPLGATAARYRERAPELEPKRETITAARGEQHPALVTAPSPAPVARLNLEELDIHVARGESLYTIFQSRGLPLADLMAVMASDPRAGRLSTLRPGDRVRVFTDADNRVQRLVHVRSPDAALHVARRAGGFEARVAPDLPAAREEPDDPPGGGAAGPLAGSAPESRLSSRSVTVTRGDSLYSIFKTNGFQLTDLATILGTGGDTEPLKRLVPGQRLDFEVDEQLGVAKMVYHLDETRSSHFTRADEGYHYELVHTPFERRETAALATIESSLFLAGQRAGLSDNVIMRLAEIFGWDVDFVLDIRSGDRFTVVYEELYKDGEKIRDGDILAAEFVNQGRRLRAVRYTYPDGRSDYFTPEGFSVRKAFLRTPVNFSRISSRFNPRRRHPVLHKIRAHRGVDYAAPRGTPVKASGDGKVVHVGRKGGYGKTIVLRHGATYSTLYAHLSRFARGVRVGARVRQGQVIGYVGSTGLATGPHLHYEFRVRGVHRDPLRVELPKAAPIAADVKDDFVVATRDLVERLELLSTTILASDVAAAEDARVLAD